MFIKKTIESKAFRSLGVEEKLALLYLISDINSCGVTSLDEGMIAFQCGIKEASVGKMLSAMQSYVITDGDEIFFTEYMREHNPVSSTNTHKSKFKHDMSGVKSQKIKAEIQKQFDNLFSIRNKSLAIAPKHHIDK